MGNSIYVACGHLLKSSERWLKLLPYRIIGIIFIAFVDLKVARYWMLHPVTLGWNILKSGKTPPSTIRSVLRKFQYKMRSFKTNCYLPEWAKFEKTSEIGAQQMRYMKMNSLGFIQLLGKVIPANSDVTRWLSLYKNWERHWRWLDDLETSRNKRIELLFSPLVGRLSVCMSGVGTEISSSRFRFNLFDELRIQLKEIKIISHNILKVGLCNLRKIPVQRITRSPSTLPVGNRPATCRKAG